MMFHTGEYNWERQNIHANVVEGGRASNLYRMNGDGSNIHRITRNTLVDTNPSHQKLNMTQQDNRKSRE